MAVAKPMIAKGVAKVYTLRDFVLRPGAKVVAGRLVADSVMPVYGHVVADSPDVVFHISLNGEYTEVSPRLLYQYGFICPSAYICTSKFDDVSRIYNAVVLPNFEIEIESASVEFINPTSSPITIYEARALLYVKGRIYEEYKV
ncbi:MAG: hypothetical protein ACO2PN_29190 [Pyrobaculum sp.]|jgi:hypothetical protein